MKLLTTRSLDYLEPLRHDLWKKTLLLSFTNVSLGTLGTTRGGPSSSIILEWSQASPQLISPKLNSATQTKQSRLTYISIGIRHNFNVLRLLGNSAFKFGKNVYCMLGLLCVVMYTLIRFVLAEQSDPPLLTPQHSQTERAAAYTRPFSCGWRHVETSLLCLNQLQARRWNSVRSCPRRVSPLQLYVTKPSSCREQQKRCERPRALTVFE